MSTRGLIAIQDPDGKVRSSYCHFDMYLDGGGVLLLEHYNSPEKVEALLALGYLSTLGSQLAPLPGEIHNYDCPLPDVCIAYHRDRGETFRYPAVWDNASYMLSRAADQYWAEYVYLFRDGEWFFDTPYQLQGWQRVKTTLQENIDE